MENVIDQHYNEMLKFINKEIVEPEIIIEDHSFSYEYGSIKGIHNELDKYIEDQILTLTRDIPIRLWEMTKDGLMDNFEYTIEKDQYIINGYIKDIQINKLTVNIIITFNFKNNIHWL
jgi:hypothetical protein